jgi:hypothetical protein
MKYKYDLRFSCGEYEDGCPLGFSAVPTGINLHGAATQKTLTFRMKHVGRVSEK